MKRKFSFLSERLFSTNLGEKNLPEILTHLKEGDDILFTRLPGFREIAFYKFLVRLACLCGGLCWTTPEEWRNAMLNLTDRDEDPWFLFVKDPFKPAFMQPPSLYDPDRIVRVPFPDEEGTMSHSRAHDIKPDKVREARPEDWAYTLIDLQTSSRYKGSGTHGTARVSQVKSDILVSLSPTASWTDRFNADLMKLPSSFDMSKGIGYQLLWLIPWDGKRSEMLDVASLHPMCIEVCRLVRMMPDLSLIRRSTSGPRVDYTFGMELFDPWTPTVMEGHDFVRAGVPAEGFDYRFINKVLYTPKKHRPSCLRPSKYDKVMTFTGIARHPRYTSTYGFHRLSLRLVRGRKAIREAAAREAEIEWMLAYLLKEMLGTGEDAFKEVIRSLRHEISLDFYAKLKITREEWLQEMREALCRAGLDALVRWWRQRQRLPSCEEYDPFRPLCRVRARFGLPERYPDAAWIDLPRTAHEREHALLSSLIQKPNVPLIKQQGPVAAFSKVLRLDPDLDALSVRTLAFLAWCRAYRSPSKDVLSWGSAMRFLPRSGMEDGLLLRFDRGELRNACERLVKASVPFCLHDALDLLLCNEEEVREAISLKVMYDYAANPS